MEHKLVDHLFRHQYGKMVAILTNFFGLSYLEMIEDAVQDTFMGLALADFQGVRYFKIVGASQAAEKEIKCILRGN